MSILPLAFAALTVAFALLCPIGPATAQESRPPLLYVEGGDFGEGSALRTPVIVVAPSNTRAAGFDVMLRFDPSILKPISVEADATWTREFEAGDGVVHITGTTPGITCSSRTRCPLFTVEWQAVGVGSSSVTADAATLFAPGGRASEMSAVPGMLNVRSVTAGDRAAGPGSGEQGLGAADGLAEQNDLGAGALALTVLLLAGGLMATAAVAAARARKRLRWSAANERPAGGEAVDWPVRTLLGSGLDRYFERVEQMGQVTDSRELGEFDHKLAVSAALLHPSGDMDAPSKDGRSRAVV